MRLSRNSMIKAVAGVAVGTGLMAGTAAAGLVMDLRFADGSKTKVAAPGAYDVEVWARVSGLDAVHTNDSLQYLFLQLVSSQIDGGAVAAGGVTGNVVPTDFLGGGRAGGAGNLTADGIGDWGSTSTYLNNSNYAYARSADAGTPPGEQAGGAVGQEVDANTWEFKISTFTFNVASVNPGAGTTQLRLTKPNATKLSATAAGIYSVWYEDGVIQNKSYSGSNPLTYQEYDEVSGIGHVTFVIPEPASLGLLAMGALGLIRRRR